MLVKKPWMHWDLRYKPSKSQLVKVQAVLDPVHLVIIGTAWCIHVVLVCFKGCHKVAGVGGNGGCLQQR